MYRIWIDVPCPYTRKLLQRAVAKRISQGLLQQTYDGETADVLWADYEDLDWDRILEGHVKANAYLVRKGLSRKAQLGYHLRKYLSKRPDCCLREAFPETLVIETWEAFESKMTFGVLEGASFDCGLMSTLSQRDRLAWCLRDAREHLERPEHQGKLWVLKPSVTNKGAEVTVINVFDQAQRVIEAWPDCREWVLQSYVDQPLLFRRKKFHLRVYVLAVGDLSVYVWNRILLLSSAVPYDAKDISNQLAHITNTVRQAEGEGFKEEECVHLLDDLVEDLMHGHHPHQPKQTKEQAQLLIGEIRRGIHEVTGELFRALHGERTVFAPQPNCFELLGLDFLVSCPLSQSSQQQQQQQQQQQKASSSSQQQQEQQQQQQKVQVHLLEVNPGPDFKQTGPRLMPVIEGLLEATLDLAVLELTDEGRREEMVLVYENHEAGAGLYTSDRKGRGGVAGMRLT